jgi:hypothetical protein
MTSAIARPRYVHCFVAAIVLTGCRYSTPFTPVRVVDVVREFDRADKRPADGFAIGQHQIDAVAHPTIAAAVPSRLTLALPLPRRGVFHARVALAERQRGARPAAVRIRVGVSDHRIYEGLTDLKLEPGERTWVDVRADLSAYAGWKWSLFYRPDRVTWRVVLAADATENVPATVLWASPEIVTDTKSAREYAERRQKLR